MTANRLKSLLSASFLTILTTISQVNVCNAQISEALVRQRINQNIPTNNSKTITASKVRTTLNSIVDYTATMLPAFKPENFGAVGDLVHNDTQAVVDALTVKKDLYLEKDYLVTSYYNKYGTPVFGPGRIMKAVTGGFQQLNSYADVGKESFGQEYLYSWIKKLRTRAAGTPLTIYLNGDSTTEGGSGGGTTASGKVDKLLEDMFFAAGVPNITIINAGVGGSNTQDWLDNLDAYRAVPKDLWIYRPGINDNYQGINLDQCIANIDQGLTEIRADKGVDELAMILMAPSTVSDTPGGRDEKWFEKLIPAMRVLARKHHCAFVDNYGIWQDARVNESGYMDKPYGDNRRVHPDDHFNSLIVSKPFDFILPTSVRYSASIRSGAYNAGIAHFAPLNANLPDTYPYGVSIMDARTTNGFPIQGQLLTVRNAAAANYCFQILTSISSTTLVKYERSAYYNGSTRIWTAWVLAGSSSGSAVRDQQTLNSDLPDTYPVGVTLDDARTANGFPAQGQLFTTKNTAGSYCVQRLYAATSAANLMYERQSYFNGSTRVWTDWYTNSVIRDKQVLAADLPDTFPLGETVDDARTANGFPIQGQLRTTRNLTGLYCTQSLTSITTTSMLKYERTAYYNGSTRSWTDWHISGSYRVSAAYDPPSIAAGAYVTTTATITGIPVGKIVRVAFSWNITSDIVLTAWVSGVNTVTARFHNIGSSPVDLSSGTLYFTADQ